MAGFQDQWRQLAAELVEHAEEFPDAAWPCRYMDYDPAIVPMPTDDCTFDSTASLRAQAQLCTNFSTSQHGVEVAPFTSHYDLCISRYDTFPAFSDNAYLRISPYWNDCFVLIFIPHINDRIANARIDDRYTLAPFADLPTLVVNWLPRLP